MIQAKLRLTRAPGLQPKERKADNAAPAFEAGSALRRAKDRKMERNDIMIRLILTSFHARNLKFIA